MLEGEVGGLSSNSLLLRCLDVFPWKSKRTICLGFWVIRDATAIGENTQRKLVERVKNTRIDGNPRTLVFKS